VIEQAIQNVGIYGMALMAVFWAGNKIVKAIRSDQADTTITESAESLVSGLADQYKLFAEANKTLTKELLEMRKNNIALETETAQLKQTIIQLQHENKQLLDQLRQLTEEIANLKRTVHQLTKI
jgi:predicted RNase H-like nuclease (RuvC/YqgF family)